MHLWSGTAFGHVVSLLLGTNDVVGYACWLYYDVRLAWRIGGMSVDDYRQSISIAHTLFALREIDVTLAGLASLRRV